MIGLKITNKGSRDDIRQDASLHPWKMCRDASRLLSFLLLLFVYFLALPSLLISLIYLVDFFILVFIFEQGSCWSARDQCDLRLWLEASYTNVQTWSRTQAGYEISADMDIKSLRVRNNRARSYSTAFSNLAWSLVAHA